MIAARQWIVAAVSATALLAAATALHAQDSPGRKELKRADLGGTDMEVILSTGEYKPGETIVRHLHHGEEAFYVLEGAMTEIPGQAPSERVQGTGGINVREVPHAGYKVVGDKTLKLVTVHIVDKGKPLYDEPPK